MGLPLSMNAVSPEIDFRNCPIIYNLKSFLLHSSSRRPFNCCNGAGLTLELYDILKMKIMPMLLFLHLIYDIFAKVVD